jgi:hypothetical protein
MFPFIKKPFLRVRVIVRGVVTDADGVNIAILEVGSRCIRRTELRNGSVRVANKSLRGAPLKGRFTDHRSSASDAV